MSTAKGRISKDTYLILSIQRTDNRRWEMLELINVLCRQDNDLAIASEHAKRSILVLYIWDCVSRTEVQPQLGVMYHTPFHSPGRSSTQLWGSKETC